MSSASATSAGSGRNNEDERQRQLRDKALKATFAKARRRRSEKHKRSSPEKGKGKERACGPLAPIDDDDVLVPREALDAAVQEVHERFDDELAELRENYQQTQRTRVESSHDTPGASGSGASHSAQAPLVTDADNLISVPARRTGLPMEEIRRGCGLEGSAHDGDWNALNTSIRDQMHQFAFDWGHSWRQQDPTQLGLLFAAINTQYPVLERFKNSWATSILVQEKFNNRKGYRMKTLRKRGLAPPATKRPRRQAEDSAPEDPQSHRSLDDLESIKQSPPPTPPPHEPFLPLSSSPERLPPPAPFMHDQQSPAPAGPASTGTPNGTPPPNGTPSPDSPMAPAPDSPMASAPDSPTAPAPGSPTTPVCPRPRPKMRGQPTRDSSHATPASLPATASPIQNTGADVRCIDPETRTSPTTPAPPTTAYASAIEPTSTPQSEPRYPARKRKLSAVAAANQTLAAVTEQNKRQRKVIREMGKPSVRTDHDEAAGSSKRSKKAGTSKSANGTGKSNVRRNVGVKTVKESGRKAAKKTGGKAASRKGKEKAVEYDVSSASEDSSSEGSTSDESSDRDDGMRPSTDDEDSQDNEDE